jgi:phospholipase/carboxylesterase
LKRSGRYKLFQKPILFYATTMLFIQSDVKIIKEMKRTAFHEGLLQIESTGTPAEVPAIGMQWLQLDKQRDALLYVPPSYKAAQPMPLAVMLHGAGGDAHHSMSLLQPLANTAGIILLAPQSRGGTWDIIEDEQFGCDVIFISEAVQQVLNQYAVDRNRMAMGGFSDGASYALCLGLINGELFTHIIALSPGFYYAPEPKGKPKVYVSHGVHDHILPIAHCSRRLVPRLQKAQYDVLYREFEGEHILLDAVRQEAVQWFLNGS